jgi:hypothetical protein
MSTRKIYFINRAADEASRSGKWRNTLKQTYKSSDAIRDIIEWAGEGKEFFVSLEQRDGGPKSVCHINPPGSDAPGTDMAAKRPVLGVIDTILTWTRDGVDFDITLLERRREQRAGDPERESETAMFRLRAKVLN